MMNMMNSCLCSSPRRSLGQKNPRGRISTSSSSSSWARNASVLLRVSAAMLVAAGVLKESVVSTSTPPSSNGSTALPLRTENEATTTATATTTTASSSLRGEMTTQRAATATATAANNLNNLKCLEVFQNDRTMITVEAETQPEKCLLRTPPSRYIQLLMDVSVGLPRAGKCAGGTPGGKPYCSREYGVRPYNAHQRQFGLDHPPDGYTMVGKQRLENFRAAIVECLRNDIPGSIVELGVWRGGAMLVAAGVLKEYQEQQQQQALQQNNNGNIAIAPPRDLYLFDAYGSIDSYGDALRPYLSVSVQQVREIFEFHDLMDEEHVHFVKGMFQDTVPSFLKEKQEGTEEGLQSQSRHRGRPRPRHIAVLRVDGNFYDSYQDSMYHFYEAVPVGGIVIFDDVFTHKPVMQFWNDFKGDQGLPEELVRIDKHSGWFRKTKDVTIDWSKFREAQDANKKEE